MAEFVQSVRDSLERLATVVNNRLRIDGVSTLSQEKKYFARLNAALSPSEGILYYNKEDTNGIQQIWRAGLDNIDAVQLTFGTAYHSWWPKQSPDGGRVMILRTPVVVGENYDQAFTTFQIWMMGPDGRGLVSIIEAGDLGSGAVLVTPNWEPNGERIVFAGGNPAIIKTCRPDGSDLQTVTVTGISSGIADTMYTNDNERILFTYLGNIYVVSTAGGTAAQLTTDGGTTANTDGSIRMNYDPIPEPTGVFVAMLTKTGAIDIPGGQPAGTWGIRLVPLTGGTIIDVLDDGNVNSKVTWGPDGFLYFHRLDYASGFGFNLARVRTDGGGLTALSNDADQHGYPNVRLLNKRNLLRFDLQTLATGQKSRARLNIDAARSSERTVYTGNASYDIPDGAVELELECFGPGGPGGSGRRGATGTVACGGTGGASGGYSKTTVKVADLVNSSLTVGTSVGGIGGAAQTVNDTNGNNGTAATSPTSYVADGADVLCQALAGGVGQGGDADGNLGGTAGLGMVLGSTGGANSATGLLGVVGGFGYMTGAGGSGGGLTAANAQSAGGPGGPSLQSGGSGGAAGTAGGGAGGAGTSNGTGAHGRGGFGGGGGGSSLASAGGAGGAGGAWGAGGGGGGASRNGNNSGAGGNGGPGAVIITARF